MVWCCLNNTNLGLQPPQPHDILWMGLGLMQGKATPRAASERVCWWPGALWQTLPRSRKGLLCRSCCRLHFNPLLQWNELQQSKDFLPVQLHLDEGSASTVMSISLGKRGKFHSSASKILNDRSGQNFSHIYREVQRKYPFFDRLT